MNFLGTTTCLPNMNHWLGGEHKPSRPNQMAPATGKQIGSTPSPVQWIFGGKPLNFNRLMKQYKINLGVFWYHFPEALPNYTHVQMEPVFCSVRKPGLHFDFGIILFAMLCLRNIIPSRPTKIYTPCNARHTRSGVKGIWLMATPVAL